MTRYFRYAQTTDRPKRLKPLSIWDDEEVDNAEFSEVDLINYIENSQDAGYWVGMKFDTYHAIDEINASTIDFEVYQNDINAIIMKHRDFSEVSDRDLTGEIKKMRLIGATLSEWTAVKEEAIRRHLSIS